MEIEKKFLIASLTALPFPLEDFDFDHIVQGYISTSPVIRIRQMNDQYILTVKSKGLLAREEFELPMDAGEFEKLSGKTEGYPISKCRYYIPLDGGLTVELDIFEGRLAGLIMAEVEFPSIQAAESFTPPDWFGVEVTQNPQYQNSRLCYR